MRYHIATGMSFMLSGDCRCRVHAMKMPCSFEGCPLYNVHMETNVFRQPRTKHRLINVAKYTLSIYRYLARVIL